jgi:Na+-transporting NADH:ubiquinone oxidoreductase subunit NqrF
MAPEYLRHLVPPTIQSNTIYPLRNGDNLIVSFCRPNNVQTKKEVVRIFLGGTAATRWAR